MFDKLTPGQQIETTVVAINGDTVFIDLNAKSEGVVNTADFTDKEGNITIKEGDKVKVFFIGEVRGEMKFSAKIASDKADNSMFENAYKNRIPVEGHVEKEIKGGFEVKLGTTRAFCPYSQMGGRDKKEATFYIGKTLSFIITEYKEGGRNLLVSNRIIEEEARNEQLRKLRSEITEGSVVEATVRSLQKFGAFVDMNGIRALLPVSELSYDRVNDITTVLKEGDKITVKVLRTDWENEKVSVSLKALMTDPWAVIGEKYNVGDKLDSVISRVADFGLFVEIENGIDGLVHISTLNLDRKTNLKKKFAEGDKISVVVKEIDLPNKRIALVPATTHEQDNSASSYLNKQDIGDTYNPFAAYFKK